MRDFSDVIAGNVTMGGISMEVGGCLGCAKLNFESVTAGMPDPQHTLTQLQI